jgi:sulfite reductase alpha subunit-like flavoprotein
VIAEVFTDGARHASSTFWANVAEGQEVALQVIDGSFKFRPGKNLIMVAVGSGIAAIMSLIHQWELGGKATRAMLVYGERYHASSPVLGEELKAKEGLELFFAISREGPKEHIEGPLQREAERVRELWTKDTELFYCGLPRGYDSCKGALLEILGGDEEKFKLVKQNIEAY